MRNRTWMWLPLLAAGLVLGGCRAEVEDGGQAPNVEVKGGDLPDIDVDPAEVDVGVSTDTQQVVVPDVDVNPRP